jgi:hypothetical protein
MYMVMRSDDVFRWSVFQTSRRRARVFGSFEMRLRRDDGKLLDRKSARCNSTRIQYRVEPTPYHQTQQLHSLMQDKKSFRVRKN